MLAALPGLFICIGFIRYLIQGYAYFDTKRDWIWEVLSIVFWPLVYLLTLGGGARNDCCGDSPLFSPDHRLSVYLLMVLCAGAYFYSAFRKALASPVLELATNCLLLIGIVLNVAVAIQLQEWILWLTGNVSIIIAFVLMLIKNHYLFLTTCEPVAHREGGWLERMGWKVLGLQPLQKLPLLVLLCLPLLAVVTGLLVLFGQRPDAFIRSFTDTYKQGLSQLDHECEGVVCGGHFLCTIAAKGHPRLVRPTRMGMRGGRLIRCNRQLLVSNAFEELLAQRWPGLHRVVRRLYNKVGDGIHRYYGVFNRRWVSDMVYVGMKPLEWCFLAVLYTLDRRPEDRIAAQYLREEDARVLRNILGRGPEL